ncbi:c-type cytochrome [Pedobacter ginsengisoli]|uniref:Photosynthetic reaction center cytochrome c subunit n=1 Tax=Pedobacter ginsengisoli TaxID=363852 RepID=A0A2D1U143_9SPHI|nr:c-type cytochrome [Pedobacter ginsengisoli]ATP55342.1 c-type cytochrome [Pedobacter ginsengisoli]
MTYKKTITLSVLLSTVVMLSAFMPQADEKPTNLKVLPKNISHDQLKEVMEGFKTALGVKCNFCHAARKDDPKKLDFASDEKHEKEIARNMMRMTMKINKKYFHPIGSTDKDGKALIAISCITCHNGKEHPQTK